MHAKNFGVLVNIPEYLLVDSKGKLKTQFLGTFFDRFIPFRFRTDWEEWKPYWDKKETQEHRLGDNRVGASSHKMGLQKHEEQNQQ